MNLKNMVRKVAAVGAGATMVGATLMGALATSLADYPAPFVSDGAFDAVLIVGDNAAAADIIGVTDIAMALQFNMKQTTTVAGTATTTFEGGVMFSANNNELNFAEDLDDVETDFDKDDFPSLFADYKLEDDDGDEDYDVEATLTMGAGVAHHIDFGRPEDDVFGDDPELYLDLSEGKCQNSDFLPTKGLIDMESTHGR